MNTEELLGQFTKVGLNVAGTYVEYHLNNIMHPKIRAKRSTE